MHLDNIQDLKTGFVGASGVEKIAIAKLVLSEREKTNKAIGEPFAINIPSATDDETTEILSRLKGRAFAGWEKNEGKKNLVAGEIYAVIHDVDRAKKIANELADISLDYKRKHTDDDYANIFNLVEKQQDLTESWQVNRPSAETLGNSGKHLEISQGQKLSEREKNKLISDFKPSRSSRNINAWEISVINSYINGDIDLNTKGLSWDAEQVIKNYIENEKTGKSQDDGKQSVEKENIILSEIIQRQIKDAKRDGYYSSEIQDVADKATLENINFDLFSHIKKLATAIKNKDSGILIALLANNDNKASQSAFKKITGVNLSGKTSAEKEKLIFDFAKISEDDINAYHAKKEAEKEADKPQKASKAKHFDSELDDFVSSLDAMQKGRAIKVLNSLWRVKGETDAAKNHIKTMVSNGLTTRTEEVSKIKEMSRLEYNRASGEEQDDHERKMKEAGTKTIYYLGNVDVGKIGFDYANYLINKPILDSATTPTTMQTSIQTLKSQFPANNGMGKIALAKLILQARQEYALPLLNPCKQYKAIVRQTF